MTSGQEHFRVKYHQISLCQMFCYCRHPAWDAQGNKWKGLGLLDFKSVSVSTATASFTHMWLNGWFKSCEGGGSDSLIEPAAAPEVNWVKVICYAIIPIMLLPWTVSNSHQIVTDFKFVFPSLTVSWNSHVTSRLVENRRTEQRETQGHSSRHMLANIFWWEFTMFSSLRGQKKKKKFFWLLCNTEQTHCVPHSWPPGIWRETRKRQ